MAEQSYVTLNDGTRIPQMGVGVYMVAGDDLTERTVAEALRLGYRHVDTAHAYGNERGVGRAIAKSGIDRDEVWVTSKLWPSEYGEGATSAAIDRMLARLGTDHLDLLLLHQQFGDYLGAWRDMERAVAAGKVRSIGISNFESDRLEELCEAATIKPSVLQVECHPFYQQRALKERVSRYGTAIECWYPLGHADAGLLGNEAIVRIAEAHGKSAAQVILRWHVQTGNIVFPKSTNPAHLAANLDVFDFVLAPDEMAAIDALDCGKRFFNMTLEQQERTLGAFAPED